ncbi:MAG: hypothetical protein UW11_C0022G0007 [Parcubacteria group bacterium GW2011_GWA2_43_9b]|uniref:TraC-like domain-containing protein n=1 Tax=Candidatus Portnoybacteria bacterium RIFCSPLOWO2_02_FULL_39_11 TaxID=1802001 RepID=A0A1G2FS00_9BACT|nr:MAG: hypothetical protein UW11_C0022G0007 [Parcubacteria group bacterium GW2011_GWA2_43_9b]OGZ40420.1 MAG: hypothetical protein A3B04_02275 [Candidatus Portnoybacteria bacterium RIFCSPLOWO2_02_FULL_39_11]
MPAPPVQQKITIEDIRDGVIIMPGGDLRGILIASSVNFSLKSTEEQDALIFKYQGFLNSLDFPVQILMVSRHLNIDEYLASIEQKRKEQTNELLRIQIAEYLDFIKNLVQVGNIMDQSFYVIVPLPKVEKKESGIAEKLGLFQKTGNEEIKSFDELKTQLWQRLEYVAGGLAGMGIKSAPLNSEEITQLFYRLYNMGTKSVPTVAPKE